MTPQILFEDDVLLVINKPAGMVVNRATSVKGETVQDWVEGYLGVARVPQVAQVPRAENKEARDTLGTLDTRDTFSQRSGVVHRLDKETSGVLILAKTQTAFEDLQRQFKERQTEKTYLALVHGEVKDEEGVIDAPVGRLPWNRERFGVLAGGREAVTRYRVERRAESIERKEKYTLLELYPKTGRTHQIRVHVKSMGHPIISDMFYAGRKTARHDRAWCPRLFLHAKAITFYHPVTKEKINVESNLPEDLQEVLAKLLKE